MRLKALAASLAAAVGLSMIQAPPASAAEPDPGTPANKIASSLKDRFRTSAASDFWITFETGADLGPAKKLADWTARGQFVYDALTAAAKDSLASVSTDLDRAGVKYTSYPIANAVLVKGGTEKLALNVASKVQVAEIHATPQVALVEPVDEKIPTDQAARPTAPKITAEAGTVPWGLDAIHAPEAWAMGATGAGITVSNLDSGVQFDHPALMHQYRGTKPDGTIDHNYNWMATRGTCTGTPCDDNGHGTHTMGTMVGDDGTTTSASPRTRSGSRQTAAATAPASSRCCGPAGGCSPRPTSRATTQTRPSAPRWSTTRGARPSSTTSTTSSRPSTRPGAPRASSASGHRATPLRTRTATPFPRPAPPRVPTRSAPTRRTARSRCSPARARAKAAGSSPRSPPRVTSSDRPTRTTAMSRCPVRRWLRRTSPAPCGALELRPDSHRAGRRDPPPARRVGRRRRRHRVRRHRRGQQQVRRGPARPPPAA